MQPVIAFYDYARRRKAYFGDIYGAEVYRAISEANDSSEVVSAATTLVPSRRTNKGAIRPFRFDDLRAFLASLGPTATERDSADLRPCRNRLMADWGWAVGLRLSEIMSLNPYQFLVLHPDVNSPFSQQAIKVTGKGQKERDVAVPNWLVADTQAYIEGERARNLELGRKKGKKVPGVLFVAGARASDPGSPFTPRRFEAIVEEACISSGLISLKPRVCPESGLVTQVTVPRHCVHDLRHTYAVYTYWIEAMNGNSEPWKVIQAQLGHERLETTIRTYLKFVQLFGPQGQQDIRTLVGLAQRNGS